jgi:Na+/proline symporter
MEQAVVTPIWHRAILLAAPILLGVYLLLAALIVAAHLTGRVELQLITWGFLLVPAFGFGPAIWTGIKWRRANNPAQRRELFKQATAELAVTLAVVGTGIYQYIEAPQAFTVI